MKTFLLPLAAVLMMASAPAFAQMTPIPKDDHAGHDHSKGGHGAEVKPMTAAEKAALPKGTFAELPNDHAIGETDAPVTMIVYASVTCPHCASWFKDDWPALKTDYVETGKMRFIFREFPTSPAQLAAANFVLASCAPTADYIKNIEYQMETQDWMFDIIKDEATDQGVRIKKILDDRGAKAGLDEDGTAACLNTQAHYDKINEASKLANAARIQAVPAILINGELHTSRDTSAATLSTAIEAAAATR